MERVVNSYSAFGISTAGESLETSSSQNVHNSHGMKKSRRLTMEQVRALEKSFQSGKLLEAGRKEELAGALGLHPRQIAIWFQNRRARWKTKQLDKDFGVLKQDYESLKFHYQTLLEEKKKLQSEIHRLTSVIKNDQNEKDKDNMGDGQIDFNIIKEIKEDWYAVNNSKDNIPPHQEIMEETYSQNDFLAAQEEDCYYNIGETSSFM